MAELRSNGYLLPPSRAEIISTGGREVGKLGDFILTFAPAMAGGLIARRVYNWGVAYFKNEKGSWTVTKTDEGAGAAAVLLFAFLVWRLAGDTQLVSMFVAGLVGRGSIVVRNTFYRLLGWQAPANQHEPDVVDVTPVSANESSVGLDEEMVREIGRYGLKNNDFRDALADGLGRRMNDWLSSQGRPPIESDAINKGVMDAFMSMAGGG